MSKSVRFMDGTVTFLLFRALMEIEITKVRISISRVIRSISTKKKTRTKVVINNASQGFN